MTSFNDWLYLGQTQFDPDDLNKREKELAELAWKAAQPATCVAPMSDKPACGAQNAKCETQADPAMAGDDLSDREIIALSRVMLAGKRTANMVAFARKLLARKRVQPAPTLGGAKEDYTRVFNMGRDSVQPASGEDAKPARAKVSSAPPPLNKNDKAFWVMGWNDCLDSMQQVRQP